MKHNLFLTAALFALLACTSELDEDIAPMRLSVPVQMEELQDTKSYLNDDGQGWNYVWENGDKINYIITRYGATKSYGEGTIKTNGTSTTLNLEASYASGDVLYAWFAPGEARTSPGSITLSIPTAQVSDYTRKVFSSTENLELELTDVQFDKTAVTSTSSSSSSSKTPEKRTVSFKITNYNPEKAYYSKVGSKTAVKLAPSADGECSVSVSFSSIKFSGSNASGSTSVKVSVYMEGLDKKAASMNVTAAGTKTKSGKTYTYTFTYSAGSFIAGTHSCLVTSYGDEIVAPVQDAMPIVATPLSISKTIAASTSPMNYLKFSMLGSGIKWNLYAQAGTAPVGEIIQSVALTSKGAGIAGSFDYNLSKNPLTISGLPEATVTSYAAQLQNAVASSSAAAAPIYMVVAPGTFASDLVVVTDKATYTASLKSMTFSRASMKAINVDLTSASVTRTPFDPEEGSVAQDQTLAFGEESITIEAGYEQDVQISHVIYLPQEVEGAQTAVTYSSSDDSVAEVTEYGLLRINGAGTATITATAEATEYWNEASASYTLEVVEYEAPEEPASLAYYEKVTSAPTAWDGTYLVVYEAGDGSGYVFAPVESYSGSNYTSSAVTIQNGTIKSDSTLDELAITVSNRGKKHGGSGLSSLEAYYVQNTEGKYVFYSESALRLYDTNKKAGTNNTEYEYCSAFKYENNAVQFLTGGMSSNKPYSLFYSNGQFIYDNANTGYIQLYKLVDGRQDQALSFSNASITWDAGEDEDYQIGSTYAMPQTVSGAQTSVTYASSDASVAEIVGNSQIKVNAAGAVTITATAEATDLYKEVSASYTLTINEHTAVPETFLGSFNLESATLTQYLDATTSYTDDNWKTVTVITNSTFSSKCGVGGEGYDFPTPVTWTGSGNQNVTVSVYTDSSRSAASLDQTVTGTTTGVKIYNLIPGRTYYYTVTLKNGSELDRGYFNTTGRRRQLKTTNTVSEDYATNVRDLGGMVTSDGRTLKYGLVYRGSNMRKTGSAEQAVIRDYMKVRLDVDLRRDEYGVTATKVFNESEVAYSHVAYDGTSMTDFLNPSKVNKTFSDIISYVSQGKAVYIHCKSGADRTGYVCMLIEAACGVSLVDCTRDYEITSFSKAGARDRCGTKNGYLIKDALNHILSAQGSTFQEKAINTLKTDGNITDAQIQALQNAMIEGK